MSIKPAAGRATVDTVKRMTRHPNRCKMLVREVYQGTCALVVLTSCRRSSKVGIRICSSASNRPLAASRVADKEDSAI